MKTGCGLILFIALLVSIPAVADTVTVEGETGQGAKYYAAVPDNWNGDLVLYAHGYVDTFVPLSLPTVDDIIPLRDMMLSNGYAVAYSSYSKFGFAVQEGVLDTLHMESVFIRNFGKPERTFLLGHSLGGMVCVNLVEKLPNRYDGVLTVAGMIGGSQVQVDYISNTRVLFEVFYEDALPGEVDDIPPETDLFNEVIPAIIGTVIADPSGAFIISQVDQTPVPFISGPEMVESYVYALGFYYRGFHDLSDRSGSARFFDNTEIEYTGALPDDVLEGINVLAPRYEGSRRAANYMRRYYEPTGALRVPHLALHNSRDPAVPVFHQAIYANKAAAAGNADLLVQRVSDRHGHTDPFKAPEVYGAFEELVDWVDAGVKP